MAMKRCANGHFYDDLKHNQCPYCGGANMNISRTVEIFDHENPPHITQKDINATVELRPNKANDSFNKDNGKTVSLMMKKKGIDPTVGWVVIIEGANKGNDFAIHSERNYIGRDQSMDITLSGDTSVSSYNHASISYSPKNNTFKLLPGDGRGIVYLNGEEVYAPAELKKGYIIELGETKLMFVPFCDDTFQW